MQEQDRRSDAHRMECEEQHASAPRPITWPPCWAARSNEHLAMIFAERGDYSRATFHSALAVMYRKRGV